jgi:parallel beta-helix repeat protein
MSKLKWYIIITLWLAFCGIASAEQFYVNESGWWRADVCTFNKNETPIQAAVDNADVNDSIYVWNGSYIENVDVGKRLTLEGEGMNVVTVSAADRSDHIFEVIADYVNISGFMVSDAQSQIGIFLSGFYLGNGTDHCNISNINASNNYYGIHLQRSNSNIISNNDISNNSYGIYIQDSSNNTLTKNICLKNYYCINLLDSRNNKLINNTADSNIEDGIRLEDSSSNILFNNSITNNRCGIYLKHSGNNTLMNNIIFENKYNFGIDGNKRLSEKSNFEVFRH